VTHRIGIDLGGTKIEACVLNDAGEQIYARRVPTPSGDYAGTIAAIARLVREAREIAGAGAHIGIGTPGNASRLTGLMIAANSTVLIGKPLKEDVERAIGCEIRMTNDANCFVLSEATDGAAAGLHCVFGAILGTGVGAGIAIDARVHEGASGLAGEWGHNPLPWPAQTSCREASVIAENAAAAKRGFRGRLCSASTAK
jgi:fructokinase